LVWKVKTLYINWLSLPIVSLKHQPQTDSHTPIVFYHKHIPLLGNNPCKPCWWVEYVVANCCIAAGAKSSWLNQIPAEPKVSHIIKLNVAAGAEASLVVEPIVATGAEARHVVALMSLWV
jgi:hypothetical protein